MNSWADAGKPARLLEKAARKDDPSEATKALSCYGLYLPELKESWLRFVDGRPVSSITTRFLCWCCHRLKARGKKALLLIWDNASWHKSREVRNWISAHNRCVKASGHGVRIVPSLLPTKSPWLNAIEPIWIHGKRKVVEPERLLGAYELAERVCKVFGCTHEEHLAIPQEVAPGQSGASLGRTGMDRVRDLVAAGGVHVMLAQDRDRFAREPAYHYLLRREFEEHGAKIRAMNDRADLTPEGELTDGILDQLGKYERAKISERSRRGTLQKAREGKVLAVHRPPYGFRYNDARDNSLVDAGRVAVI